MARIYDSVGGGGGDPPGTQTIDSEILQEYQSNLSLATPAGAVRTRPPFRRTDQPLLNPATDHRAWAIVKKYFKDSTQCFHLQPDTGGAEPPDPGPRSRGWWFNASAGSGLFYYDYFIQQTLLARHSGIVPSWCVFDTVNNAGKGSAAFSLGSRNPVAMNFGSDPTSKSYISVQVGGDGWFYRAYLRFNLSSFKKKNLGNCYLSFYCPAEPYGGFNTMEIWLCKGDWNQYELTWENAPATRRKVATFTPHPEEQLFVNIGDASKDRDENGFVSYMIQPYYWNLYLDIGPTFSYPFIGGMDLMRDFVPEHEGYFIVG